MAYQRFPDNRKRRKRKFSDYQIGNSIKEFFMLIIYVLISPFTRDFWFKREENNSSWFTYGTNYKVNYTFRWQRLFNIITVLATISLFLL